MSHELISVSMFNVHLSSMGSSNAPSLSAFFGVGNLLLPSDAAADGAEVTLRIMREHVSGMIFYGLLGLILGSNSALELFSSLSVLIQEDYAVFHGSSHDLTTP